MKTHGRAPSDYAAMGYELMLILGKSAEEKWCVFSGSDGKSTCSWFPTEGVNYQTKQKQLA